MQTLELDKSIMENMVAMINKSSNVVFTTAHLAVSEPTPIQPVEGQTTIPFHNTTVTLVATDDSPVPGSKTVRYHRLHLDLDFSDSPRTLHVLQGKTAEEIAEIMRTTYQLHVDSVFTGAFVGSGITQFKLTADDVDLLYVGSVTVAIIYV